MRDIFNNLLVKSLTTPATATSTVTSGTCDRLGYESATFFVHYGTSGDTLTGSLYWSAALQESDDDSTYTAVAAANVIGASSNAFGLANAMTEDDAVYALGYNGTKRYVQVVVTATGSVSSGMPIGIFAVLGHANKAPTSQTVTP